MFTKILLDKIKKYVFWGIKITLVIYLIICLYIYINQSKYMYHPSNNIERDPSSFGINFDQVTLITEDGVKIVGWFIPAKPSNNSITNHTYTILYCHGNAGNISEHLEIAIELIKMNYNVMLFDYRGYGLSEGKPTEIGTYLDAMSTWKYLTENRGIESNKIIIYGWSLGGSIAAWLATKTKPYALILESTFASAKIMAHRMFPYLPTKLLCRYNYNTMEYVKNIQCPVLVAHSPQDKTVPFEDSFTILANIQTEKEFVRLKGGHNDGRLLLLLDGQKAFDNFIRKKR